MTGLRGCLKTYYDCSLKKVLAERRLVLTAWQTCSRCKTDGVGFSNDAETTFRKYLLPYPWFSIQPKYVHLYTLNKDKPASRTFLKGVKDG